MHLSRHRGKCDRRVKVVYDMASKTEVGEPRILRSYLQMASSGPRPPPRPARPPAAATSTERQALSAAMIPAEFSQEDQQRLEFGHPLSSTISQDPGWQTLLQLLGKQANAELQQMLQNESLLQALSSARAVHHPSYESDSAAVAESLSSNLALAKSVAHQEELLIARREQVENHLLALHTLERQWRKQQGSLDRDLEKFSPQSLYRQMTSSIAEADERSDAVIESFLSKDGPASDREVSEWVRAMREGRARYWTRKARKERWDEGRVGGWR